MKRLLIYVNLLIINFLLIYFLIRVTGDTQLNVFLDATIEYLTSIVDVCIALIIGIFIPQEKATQLINKIKK